MSKRRIEVPERDYQPTKAEMEEPIIINRGGLSVDEAAQRIAQRLTTPTEVVRVSAADWRKRRKKAERRNRSVRLVRDDE